MCIRDRYRAIVREIVQGTMQAAKENEIKLQEAIKMLVTGICLLYTSPSPRDRTRSRMPSSA